MKFNSQKIARAAGEVATTYAKSMFLLALAAGASASQAAAIDVTAIVAFIAEQAVPISLIGGAVLLIVVGIYAFKWVRRAMA
jgi:hypothetical protein